MLNRKYLLAVIFFIALFLISAVNAEDVNVTDSDTISSDDCDVIQSDDNISTNYSQSVEELNANQTELTSPTETIYYKGSYNVTLKDSNSTLPNKTVNFVIGKVIYNATTDNNGVARVNPTLNPGKYAVTASFAGDDDYAACNLTSSVRILATIKADSVSKFYKGSEQYSAQFFNSQGNVLAETDVNITVNGKVYPKKTNKNGVVSVPVNLKPGTYKIIASDPLTGYNLTTVFKIYPTITANDVKKVEGDSRKFNAKFLKDDGKPLAKQYVKFKINGKTYKVKTDSNGKASIPLNLKKGNYNIVCYNKDGFSKTYNVKVFKRKASTSLTTRPYTYYLKETKVLKVKLSTVLGDYSHSGKVIQFKVNGKTYSKKTDKDGWASLKLKSLKKGLYSVEYKYPGNKFFKESKSKRLLLIIADSKAKVKVKSTVHFGYGAGTHLKVAYVAGGVALPKKTVTLTINGKDYKKTTDSKGMISLPITLKIGKYTANYKTGKYTKINASSGSFKFDVFKRSPSKISWACGNSFKDDVQYFKVLVKDSNGKHVSGGKITLTIDGKTYTSKVGSKGYASFKTNVIIGKYKISVKYKGNNNVLPSSASKQVTVKLSKFGNGINEKNAANLMMYLKSSSHCPVGNGQIKSLVKSLTKGLTSDVDKAKALFNYVRDTLDYSYYYDTGYGAVGTLNHKSGNCVDHSHLLISMYRTAGLKARYVHGTCYFIQSRHTYGHVWTQVKIGNEWVCGDAISYKNSLGKINNWNTKSYTIHAKYASLPF